MPGDAVAQVVAGEAVEHVPGKVVPQFVSVQLVNITPYNSHNYMVSGR